MERTKRAERAKRGEQAEPGAAAETLATIATDGATTTSQALFDNASERAMAQAERILWGREGALWLAVALAVFSRGWRLAISPAVVGVALGSVLGVALAYVWMRRAFGWSVAAPGALLLAADGFAVAVGRSAMPIGLVPALLALWLLLLCVGAAWGNVLWLVVATLPLALAAAIVPIAGVLTPVALAALALLPARTADAAGQRRAASRVWGMGAALVALPLAGVALGVARAGGAPPLALAVPRGLEVALAVTVIVGWLALGALLVRPAGALWRWYALASDPHERRWAVWSRLREDARWRLRALLWLAVVLPALALPFAPRSVAVVPLLPAALALPGMAGEEVRARMSGKRAAEVWGVLLALLALALAIAALWR